MIHFLFNAARLKRLRLRPVVFASQTMTEGEHYADAIEWESERLNKDRTVKCPVCSHQSDWIHRCKWCGRDLAAEHSTSGRQRNE